MKMASFVFILLVLSSQLFADGTPAEGAGTENDPYQIETLDNLLWLSTTEAVWDSTCYFIQTADIDASDTQTWNEGAGFSPIGYSVPGNGMAFRGKYNGNYHIINGLYINRLEEYNIGLFGRTYGAIIEELGIVNASISGINNVGVLLGYCNATEIMGCYAAGIVSGEDNVGGLVGNNWGTTICDSYASGSVSGNYCVGGLTGYNIYDSSICESYANCNVSGNNFLGGLVGYNYLATIIESYYDYETVLINDQHLISIGALGNEMYNDWINNNMNLEITDYLFFDGENYLINNIEDFRKLLAFGHDSEYSFQLTSDLDLTGNPNFFIPYFAGTFNGYYHIISGLDINSPEICIIGLFGYTIGATIEAIGVTDVNVIGSYYVGGLVGIHVESTISKSFISGNVASGGSNIGGLVGKSYLATISESYANVSVSGDESVGGLAGNNTHSTISNCYATGNVSGTLDVGGLVGANFYTTTSECYASGSVIGNGFVGGLIGGHYYNSTIINCIWNVETSGLSNGVGFEGQGTILNLRGATTAEMQIINTYTDISWDFVGEIINGTEDFWDINSILNNGYPYISDLEWSFYNNLLANFEATPTSGLLPLTVNFFDGSFSGSPITSWQWDFENDGVIDSYEQNPTWVYNEPGIYSVSLTVSDDIERDTSTELKENYIEVLNQIHYGDIDNNAVVESYDAGLLLMYVVGLDPLPEDPVPWEAWRLLWADVDVNGEVEALDAAYILQYVVGIITEFPVTRIGGNPEIAISLSNDSEYIYLNSDKQIISLEYKIIESRNLTIGNAETEREDCLYYQNEQHLALISAEGISGNILKIPYERTGNADCSLVMEFECNGFIENIYYTFDPVHLMTRLNTISPNPFNPLTNICFEIEESGDVLIQIYNLRGQKVETLADGYYGSGKHNITWDAHDLVSGIYFINIKTGS
ncbi:MAG: GLUG motif-containing protein, partial [Candidatus Stygibacter australis]|nr:GLUG motif-containing protein [Candidatus Stygibacter australis]